MHHHENKLSCNQGHHLESLVLVKHDWNHRVNGSSNHEYREVIFVHHILLNIDTCRYPPNSFEFGITQIAFSHEHKSSHQQEGDHNLDDYPFGSALAYFIDVYGVLL